MGVYVIGDIHGCCGPLRRLIDRVAPAPGDVMVQLGDCVNRGLESFEVVEYWLRFDRCTRFVIGGNHEELMYDYLVEGSRDIVDYGGAATVDSYRRNGWECRAGDPTSIPTDHLEFYLQTLKWTRPFLRTSRYLFTHAGYDFGADPSSQNPYTLRWGRVSGWKAGMPTVIRGHTPQRRVRTGGHVINLDTGCGLGGPLSCLCLDTGEVISEATTPRAGALPESYS